MVVVSAEDVWITWSSEYHGVTFKWAVPEREITEIAYYWEALF